MEMALVVVVLLQQRTNVTPDREQHVRPPHDSGAKHAPRLRVDRRPIGRAVRQVEIDASFVVLADVEKEIEGVLLSMISEQQMASFKEEAMRELKMFEGKVELPVYQEMIRRSLIKAVRNQYRLPRLSLFYM